MKISTSNIVSWILAVVGIVMAMILALNCYKTLANPTKRAARLQGVSNYYSGQDGELRDRVELDARYQRVVAEVDHQVERELDSLGLPHQGHFYHGGQIKKKILRQHYGIDWRPVDEMNSWTTYN